VRRWIRIFILVAVAALVVPIALCFVYPDVSKLKKENPQKTSFMEYREGQWRDEGKNITIRRQWVPLSRISNNVTKAALIAEDDKFWKHKGFDFDAIEKALEKDLKEKKFKFGGSTITQQLAKNLYLTPSKNPIRKIREAIYTWRLEKSLSKRRILELYLNVAEWGEGIFGIEAAARYYYRKSAAALGPIEAARLVSALPNPRKYNPIGNSGYINNRSRIIYRIMVRRGIVVEDYEEITSGAEARQDAGKDLKQQTGPAAAQPPAVAPGKPAAETGRLPENKEKGQGKPDAQKGARNDL
jgi:monofunctional biosynthetic peptidoglycan transglycosylase